MTATARLIPFTQCWTFGGPAAPILPLNTSSLCPQVGGASEAGANRTSLHITEQQSTRHSSLTAGRGLKHTAAQELQLVSKDVLALPPLERMHVFASCKSMLSAAV